MQNLFVLIPFNKDLCFQVRSAMVSMSDMSCYICKLSLHRFLLASKQIRIWASGHLIVKLHQIKHFRAK